MLDSVRRTIRRFGFDVVRYPYWYSLEGHIARLLKEQKVNVVLDVGANTGQFGRALRREKYTGLVLSFEPVSGAFERLVAAARGDDKWQCYRIALGDEEAERSIRIARESSLSSFLRFNDYGQRVLDDSVVEHTETVQVRRLDAVFPELAKDLPAPRAFLKIDTQGWDAQVLRGAQGCLGQVVLLQAELSVRAIYDGMTDWVGFIELARLNSFDLLALYPVNYDSHGRVLEFDGLFKTCGVSTSDRA